MEETGKDIPTPKPNAFELIKKLEYQIDDPSSSPELRQSAIDDRKRMAQGLVQHNFINKDNLQAYIQGFLDRCDTLEEAIASLKSSRPDIPMLAKANTRLSSAPSLSSTRLCI